MMTRAFLLLLLSTWWGDICVYSVDQSKFRQCDTTSFCRRNRLASQPPMTVQPNSLKLTNSSTQLIFQLARSSRDKKDASIIDESVMFNASLMLNSQGNVHFRVVEAAPISGTPRWEQPPLVSPSNHTEASSDACSFDPLTVTSSQDMQLTFSSAKNDALCQTVVVQLNVSPHFQLIVKRNNVVLVSFNQQNGMYFEHHQTPPGKDSEQPPSSSKKGADPEDVNDVHGGKTIEDYGEDGLAIYTDGSIQATASSRVLTETRATETIQQPLQEEGAWRETFQTHVDSKPFGPASVGLDVTFHKVAEVYGIPEHATDFALGDTVTLSDSDSDLNALSPLSEPYRLYNLDVFEYDLDVPHALYGAIPLMLAHGKTTLSTESDTMSVSTVGVYWSNPSETFVDVRTTLSSSSSSTTASSSTHDKQVMWMSESGIIEIYLFLGPTPAKVLAAYTHVTGLPSLPPLFALGYHQCRWNYNNEADVARVLANFESHYLPFDVLWLDIEHTDGKRYFTWDAATFPTPISMQAALSSTGRKMVTIVDPHLKRDEKYATHVAATAANVYVKDAAGKDFDGWCWPGASSYVDFTSSRARAWWAAQFHYSTYVGSTPDLYTWNDMNEPSVFNGPEVSMPKDCRNIAGIEHREWHNLYGMYMHRATAEGQVMRQSQTFQKQGSHEDDSSASFFSWAKSFVSSQDSDDKGEDDAVLPESAAVDPTSASTRIKRPFVLSRAFAAGSQQYGAIWTGDNAARWDHLAIATKMLLSMSVVSLVFVGADVGGFFGNPSDELLVRWYQAAVYQPFFRAHAHHDAARREPYLYKTTNPEAYAAIRDALLMRYQLLPTLYTLFHLASTTGLPVMRPLWFEFPADPLTFSMDNAFMLGPGLLIHPVTVPLTNAILTQVYLPLASDVLKHGATGGDLVTIVPTWWYTSTSPHRRYSGGATVSIDTSLLSRGIPVFYRGGHMLVTKRRLRRSTSLMTMDPHTLMIPLDPLGVATGSIYLDDEQSLDSPFSLISLHFANHTLSCDGDKKASHQTLERIVLLGIASAPLRVLLNVHSTSLMTTEMAFSYDVTDASVTVKGTVRVKKEDGTTTSRPTLLPLDESWDLQLVWQ